MSQDNKKSFVMYQGNGSNNVFSVPMTKGKYGTISVAFVRRGLDQYEYNPDTWGLNGGLFAWDLSGTKVYTDTATPAIGATVYDQYGVDTGDTVTAVGGATITVNTNVYTRDALHDVDENTVLTWTGDTLQVGDYIVIERTTTRTQPFEFQNNQKHIEKSDDNLERQIQEVADKVDNALLVDPTHTIDSNKMNPVEWMKTILRSVDKSVRGFRYLNGWLDYSLDDPNIADVDKTWTHLVNTDNIKAIREQSRIENNETIYYTEYLAQDGSWKTLSDPHKWDNMKLSDLADTYFTGLSAGNFIMFDGLKWKNVYSSATVSWGAILGNIDDQADLKAKFDKKLDLSGGTLKGDLYFQYNSAYPKLRIVQSGQNTNILRFLNNSYATQSISFDLSQGAIHPLATGGGHLGTSAIHFGDAHIDKIYTGAINNGYDISVPVTNSADSFALESEITDINSKIPTEASSTNKLALKREVNLAASSGEQLYATGVWYAKMYAATTVPTGAEYNGRNYADFSQVGADNNPVIKIYTGASGVWTLTETITPPADHVGYMTITSKIWDIAEQAGQQGGKVLWDYTHKTFTPYPQIISFENAALTGTPTAPLPTDASPNNQIATKEYVDSHSSTGGYHPGLLSWEWDDHLRDDVSWLHADTFSWQSGSVYEAAFNKLFNDIYTYTTWYLEGEYLLRTYSPTPSVGDQAYLNSEPNPVPIGLVQAYDSVNNTITVNNKTYAYNSNQYVTPVTETVAGITVTYYPGTSGRKIVAYADMSAVESVYTATGVAWYYIIDIPNKRFKLPRAKHNKYADTLGVVGNGYGLGITNNGTNDWGIKTCEDDRGAGVHGTGFSIQACIRTDGLLPQTGGSQATTTDGIQLGISTDATKSGIIAQQTQDTDQYKYLYFYVGAFTQEAIENTAGINTEDFNDKADTDFGNTNMIDYVVAKQDPSAGNGYTWYRKYKSGWVEQGGYVDALGQQNKTITLPIVMADTNYTVQVTNDFNNAGNQYGSQCNGRSTTQIIIKCGSYSSGDQIHANWQVSGMAA